MRRPAVVHLVLIIDFDPVKIGVFVFWLSAESKSIHHRHVVEHFFVFAYHFLGVELRAESLAQVLYEWVVDKAIFWLISFKLWLRVAKDWVETLSRLFRDWALLELIFEGLRNIVGRVRAKSSCHIFDLVKKVGWRPIKILPRLYNFLSKQGWMWHYQSWRLIHLIWGSLLLQWLLIQGVF